MKTFILPDLGEGLQDAEIVAWHVAAGDHVVADQPLVAVETDKAVIEIPSPQAGRIETLFAKAGERVKVGAPLAAFEAGAHADTGTVVGELMRPPTPLPESASPETAITPEAAAHVKAAPAVRARAQALGVALAAIRPTGPGNAVTMADVEAAAASPGGAEALRGLRRAMAQNMTRAGREIVPATVSEDADIDDWPANEDVTIRLIRAVVAGCRAVPALNAWYDGEAMERRLQATIDLGLAVDTEDGLMVPVLRNVGGRDRANLRQGIDTLRADARARKVPLGELRGQTITLSNFGMFGGRYAALVVVPPQVAILGAGAIRLAVLAHDGQPKLRRILPLSLTFDHRAVTGTEAARFLRAAIGDLEQVS